SPALALAGVTGYQATWFSQAAVGPNDNIVLAGEMQNENTGSRVASLVRFTADGHYDGSFASGGAVTTTFGAESARAGAVTFDSRGRLVAAGTADRSDGLQRVAVARYLADGDRDLQFGVDGEVAVPTSQDWEIEIEGVAVQTTGLIVAVGMWE